MLLELIRLMLLPSKVAFVPGVLIKTLESVTLRLPPKISKLLVTVVVALHSVSKAHDVGSSLEQ